MDTPTATGLLPLLCCLAAAGIVADGAAAEPAQARPLYVFCGTGDHLWPWDKEPVDSRATIDAMFEWMAKTYGVKRMYWRGGQQRIWVEEYQVGDTEPLQHDWAEGWCRHLLADAGINDFAVRAARRHGMEISLYTGLFEHGVQPDVGVVCPYPIEDRLRIEHPEWCMADRWGERRCPGPISFAYPEARRALVERYVRHVTRHGYDGITFYTYVENVGIRYPEEFGFNAPVVAEFRRRYPDVDPRTALLTEEQREHWQRCRGRFVTDFLRELRGALKPHGKRVTMILDSKQPDLPQPWWGKPIPGTGNLRLDWEAWVNEGLVDELWVQLGSTADQQALLGRLLVACAGKPVRLVVRAVHPLQDPSWEAYRRKGVTPISCITSPVNDIERYTLEPTSAETLSHSDWRVRAQTLADMAAGKVQADAARVAPLARDPHVLVRRRAVQALGALGAAEGVPAVEGALSDAEPSVRVAAAVALAQVNGPRSAGRILAALERDHHFQMKLASVHALGKMGEHALPVLIAAMKGRHVPAREVSVRALYELGKAGHHAAVYAPMRAALVDASEDPVVCYWAANGLLGLRERLAPEQRRQVAADLLALVQGERSVLVQLHAAYALGYFPPYLGAGERGAALAALTALFRRYGDGCRREDAAYGWRIVGNALLGFGAEGKQALDAMRAQDADRWLAWIAYEVVHVPQRSAKMELTTEAEAVETHRKYAPAFPGYRRW